MGSKRILLIEDDDLIRDLYKRQLDLAGLATDGFPNGKEGLESLTKNHYDLVLLDILLPDINGLEILKKIKDDQANKELPVVLLTNLGQDEIVKQGFNLGAEGYLIKLYYTPEKVIEEVRNILAKKAS